MCHDHPEYTCLTYHRINIPRHFILRPGYCLDNIDHPWAKVPSRGLYSVWRQVQYTFALRCITGRAYEYSTSANACLDRHLSGGIVHRVVDTRCELDLQGDDICTAGYLTAHPDSQRHHLDCPKCTDSVFAGWAFFEIFYLLVSFQGLEGDCIIFHNISATRWLSLDEGDSAHAVTKRGN